MKVIILAEIKTKNDIWNNLGYYESYGLKIKDIVEYMKGDKDGEIILSNMR